MSNLAFALLALVVPAQWQPNLVVDPFVVTSPSGAWRAEIEPGDRFGNGPCEIHILRDGKAAATAKPPFTFEVAAITDRGFVVGHGRTDTYGGEFVVGVVAPDGNVVRDERTKITDSHFEHTPPNPNARGLVVDPAGKWFALRVADEDVNRGLEAWWRYPIATAEARQEVVPAEHMEKQSHEDPWLRLGIRDARAVPATQWVLVNWDRREKADGAWSENAVFTLIDDAGDVKWRLDLPHDHEFDETTEGHELERQWNWNPAILALGDGGFTIWHVREKQQVEYRIESDVATCRAVEVGRRDYAPPVAGVSNAPLHERRLTATRTVELLGAQSPPPLHDLVDFGFGADGKPVAIRRDGDHWTAVFLGDDGALLREVAWQPLPGKLGGGSVELHALGAGEWLVSARTWDNAEHGWFNVAAVEGEMRRLTGMDDVVIDGVAPDAKGAARTADGGFVVLTAVQLKYTIVEALLRCTSEGRALWSVQEEFEDPHKLFSPQDVAVLSDGTIAVLENIANKVQLYDDRGGYLATLDLTKALGKEPSYLSSIHADSNGAMLIEDFHGDPTAWRMTRDGQVTAKFTPHFAGGNAPEALARHVRAAPDGAAWTMDEGGLYLLDEHGAVFRTLGQEARVDRLDHAGDVAIDARGRVWILDTRSGALHGFDADGHPVFVAALDGQPKTWRARVTARADGGIFVEPVQGSCNKRERWVRFDGQGRKLEDALIADRDLFLELPGPRYVATGWETPLLVLDEAGKIVASQAKGPDGKWARPPTDGVLALDGRAALLWCNAIVLVDANAATIQQIPLPRTPWYGSRLTIAGTRALVSGGDPEALLYSFASKTWDEVTFAEKDNHVAWTSGLSADGTEILAVDSKTHTLRHFEIE